jgi:hypothetical protein
VQEPLYYKSGALIQHLLQWSSTSPTAAGRLEELIIDLFERQYVEYEDVQLTQQWLLALHKIGYKFPSVRPSFNAVGA